jgi:hypothetical protein
MVKKKINVIKEWVESYLSSGFVDGIINEFNIPSQVGLVMRFASSLDRFSFLQMALAKWGVYKYMAYLIYLIFLA